MYATLRLPTRVSPSIVMLLLSATMLAADDRQDLAKLEKQRDELSRSGRFKEATIVAEQVVQLAERSFQSDPAVIAMNLNELAKLVVAQGRLSDAERLFARTLAIREETLGKEHPDTATSLGNLAAVYQLLGRYIEAEAMQSRALAIREEKLGKMHVDVAKSLGNLANLRKDQGRYAEAELLYARAMVIFEELLGAEHSDTAICYNNLGVVRVLQGRYADAAPLYERVLAIREKLLGKEHPDVALTLMNLANLYRHQYRYIEAKPLYIRAQTILERTFGGKHPWAAANLHNLGLLYKALGQYREAEQMYVRSLEIQESIIGREHPDTADTLHGLANLISNQEGRDGEAESLYKRGLLISEKARGKDHPHVGSALFSLAIFYSEHRRPADAAKSLDRAILILERGQVTPAQRFEARFFRASIAWKNGLRKDALADLKIALDLAEQQRSMTSGGDRERAEYFASFADAFERMVEWQAELGDVGEGLAAIERSRARSLQDQMSSSGVDLLAGLPADQAAKLKQRENKALANIAGIEKNIRDIDQRPSLSIAQKQLERNKLAAELKMAREEYAKAYADIRANSPAYRLAVGQDQKPITLEALQTWVASRNGLLLEYLIGEKGGYLLVVPAEGKPRIEKLALSAEQAKILSASAGPLTGKRLHDVLANQQKTGVLQLLSNENESGTASKKLAALWTVLIPESERAALREGKYQKLFIAPDGELAAFPFETLVADPIGEPEYLVNFGPPIIYAPSATILHSLEQRKKLASSKQEPILSVGVANYSGGASANDEGSLAILTPQAKVRRAGIELIDLPGAVTECDWVRQNYQQEGFASRILFNADANEERVRRELPGRHVIHFACHGLVDESPGNLFGALALAPSKSDDPANDGFFTLAEIYSMNLTGCELTLLSACETNLGPQQKGEGSLALSRGFLVAGSRRVIASNWLVSDEAAPTLVSYLTALIAQAEKEGRTPDYAAALQEAKRAVRQNPKWKDPFFWAPMVLVGPK